MSRRGWNIEEHPKGSGSYRLRARVRGRLITIASGACEGNAVEARREQVPNGRTVYFAATRMLVKIGFSDDPPARIAALSRVRGEPIELAAGLPGGRALEAFLHDAFRDCRHEGEWFHNCGPVAAAVARLRGAA